MSTKTQNGGQAVATTPSKNSTAVKAETSTAISQTPHAVEKPKAAPKPIISVAQQREKAEKLNALFEREGKLRETLLELDQFKLASVESQNRLTLTDGKGASFSTSSPAFVGMVLQQMKAEAEKQLFIVNGEIIALA